MNTEQKIKAALAIAGISQSELARRLGTSPQNLNQKVKRDALSLEDFAKIAEAIGADWCAVFRFPDGTEI